ncbi:MAG: 2-octaprenyl-6-methoxyphenyl hydroxylase [Legionellales bacterium]|nr:2-octaprenyl-6-methoxyphenyl hydroxylase [Legionellales bacterium]
MMQQPIFDIVIVGGGPISMSLVLSLQGLPINIAIIEATDIEQRITRQEPDLRSLALSQSSQRILTGLGVWSEVETQAVALTGIHISKQAGLFATRMSATECQLPAFGYVLGMQTLLTVLQKTLMTHENVTWFSPARVTQVTQTPQQATVVIKQNNELRSLHTKWVIAADGTHSKIRQMVGIPVTVHDYQHSAIVANVTLATAHQQIAYERFYPSGPMAMLPNARKQVALIWSLTDQQAQTMQQLPDRLFLTELQKKFGYRLGKFTQVSPRHNYPLMLTVAEKNYQGRVLLLGNAAHTLHPIAGQGFNLGLRDVAALSELIREFQAKQQLDQTHELLKRYVAWRREDQLKIVTFTDGLINFFAHQQFPMTALQNLSLLAADVWPLFKTTLQQVAMGLDGFVPDLVSGYRKWKN